MEKSLARDRGKLCNTSSSTWSAWVSADGARDRRGVSLSSSSTVHAHLKALEQGDHQARCCADAGDPRGYSRSGKSGGSGDEAHRELAAGRSSCRGHTVARMETSRTRSQCEGLPRRGEGSCFGQGESMVDDGIRNGDLWIVRRQTRQRTAIRLWQWSMTSHRETVLQENGRIRLQPANQSMARCSTTRLRS